MLLLIGALVLNAFVYFERKNIKGNVYYHPFENFEKKWISTIEDIMEKHGAWENRRNYIPWTFKEVA